MIPLIALFLSLLFSTTLRHVTTITVTDDLIRLNSLFDTTIYWKEINDISLSYFSLWRTGGKGWMQLRLKKTGKTIRIESSLEGFEEVISKALEAVHANQIHVNTTTASNLEALGLNLKKQEVEI